MYSTSNPISQHSQVFVEDGYKLRVDTNTDQTHLYDLSRDPLEQDEIMKGEETLQEKEWMNHAYRAIQEVDSDVERKYGVYRVHQNTFPIRSTTRSSQSITSWNAIGSFHFEEDQLEPILLMAHLDVVPVLPDTLDKWTYPPFEGFVDWNADKVFGRGASDVKTLIAQLEAVFLSI
ncbi:hypothetical protein HDU98_004399 [Podochytrium sp. JEL0797]|nr:hypothetical protein HDU98_004399 [Podochytrium sp. JEL0797]